MAYLRQFAIAFACLLIVAVLANLLVDPYRLWAPRIGWDASKPRPRAVQHDALLKLRGIARTRPVTVILGNSRAEIGLDPRSLAWPADAKPVYNGAVPGSGVADARNMLSAAIASGRLRHAVIGIDFLDFLVEPGARESDPLPIGRSRPGWASDLPLLLSLDTLSDSVVTLLAASDADAADVRNDGFNPLHEYRRYARQQGYASIFTQKDAANARDYVKQPKSVFAGASRTSSAWQALDETLRLASAAGIDARFVIYPYHARILEMFYRAGLADAFKAWKRELANRVGAGAGACRLWDFSGYNDFSTEAVPEPRDKETATRWYWESGHFKSRLGDLILGQMYGEEPAAFGRCLTPADVDAVNAGLDREHAAFEVRNPRAVAEINRLFATTSP
jgi:hypothetical protein